MPGCWFSLILNCFLFLLRSSIYFMLIRLCFCQRSFLFHFFSYRYSDCNLEHILSPLKLSIYLWVIFLTKLPSQVLHYFVFTIQYHIFRKETPILQLISLKTLMSSKLLKLVLAKNNPYLLSELFIFSITTQDRCIQYI